MIFNKKNKSIEKKEYENISLGIIKTSDILNAGDFKALEGLKTELKDVFLTSQVFRTRTEMEISVLNDIKFPTPASKYWQSIREQNVMFQELVMLSYEYRKNLIKIKMLQRDIKNEQDNLKKELIQINLEKKYFILRNQEKTAKDRIRELKDWSEIKQRESKMMSKEELGSVDNHQLISYTKRWIKQSITMGQNGSPAERQNLLGQLRSGILACIKNNILDEVLKDFDYRIQKKVKKEYGIQD